MRSDINKFYSDEELDAITNSIDIEAIEAKIKAEGDRLPPPPKEMMENILIRCKEEDSKKNRFKRYFSIKNLRIALGITVIMLLTFGVKVTGIGSKNFTFFNYKRDKIKSNNSIVINNGDFEVDNEEKQAYDEIKTKLGMVVLQLGYKPEGMVYKSNIILLRHAIMQYSFLDKLVTIEQSIGPVEESINIIASNEPVATVTNIYVEGEINIYEELLDTGESQYCTIINYDKFAYTIMGAMDLEEFIKMIEEINIV